MGKFSSKINILNTHVSPKRKFATVVGKLQLFPLRRFLTHDICDSLCWLLGDIGV